MRPRKVSRRSTGVFLSAQREERLHQRPGGESRYLGARGLGGGLSLLLRPELLRAGLKQMIESKRELLATKPEEQIACWSEQLEKANIKRSRYQAQEAEGLMTRQELRAKLAELDETVDLAEAEIEKLRHHEKSIKAMARSYSNATPSSYPNS